jgi:uncharacterized membrane protein
MQELNPPQHTEGKTEAILAYLTIIGLVIAFVMNNEKKYPFATYHIKQSLGLMITGLILAAISLIPVVGWLVYIVGIFLLFFLWIVGLIKAVNGKMEPVPVLGEKYLELFKNL